MNCMLLLLFTSYLALNPFLTIAMEEQNDRHLQTVPTTSINIAFNNNLFIGHFFRHQVSKLHTITQEVLTIDNYKIDPYRLSESDKEFLIKSLDYYTKHLLIKDLGEPYFDLQLTICAFFELCKRNYYRWNSLHKEKKITAYYYKNYLTTLINLMDLNGELNIKPLKHTAAL